MRVWITKYALTSGIIVREVEQKGDMVSWKETNEYGMSFAHREGRDWHRSEDAALQRAERMRRDKIASLHKSIAKFECMRFAPKAT